MDQDYYYPQENENYKGLSDYLAILKRRKWQLLLPAILILAVSATLAYKLPPIYRSEATILIEQQQIPTDLVRSTVTSYASERIQIISQRVMTSDNLGKIIDEFGLYKNQRTNTGLSILTDKLRNNINLDMVSAKGGGKDSKGIIAFKLSFTNENPRMAQKVTNELVSLYLNENLKRRTQSALETTGFLAAEAARWKEEVNKLEGQLAAFKQKNINNLPEHQSLTLQLMQRSEAELVQTNQQIRTLEDRKIYLETEIAQWSPTEVLSTPENEDRLRALEEKYAHLSVRYTDEHPTIVKLKEEIETLKKQQTSSVDQAQEGPIMTQTQTTNPVYLQLQNQLNATNSELSSLSITKQKLQETIKEFEQRLMQGPQIEREYHNLTRDYDNALAKFKEIKSKQLEAELAESLERESKGERFSLIEPPQVPFQPIKPNRKGILFLGIVLSFAGGIGHVVLREVMDQTIHGSKEVMTITKAPPLAVIPYIHTSRDKERGTTWRIVTVVVAALIALAGIVAIHYYYMPLDVLWYVVLRKLGIQIEI